MEAEFENEKDLQPAVRSGLFYEIIKNLMQCVADTAEHDFFSVTIIIDDGKYFVFEELNVNWQSPCLLYQYDTDAGALQELSRWEDVKLQGISLAAERSGS